MIKRMLIAIVLLAGVGGGLVWFNMFRDQMIAEFFANMPVQPLAVSTVVAEPVTWQPTIAAIGTANAAQGVELTVEAAGIVRERLFSSNQQVSQGDVLLRLDDSVQAADLEAARTQLEQERAGLERIRELQSRGVATSVSLEAAQAAFQAAEAQMARATALVEQRKVIAPFSGTIGLPRVELGQYLSPGTAVATLQDLDNMRVDFSLPEQQLPRLSVGQQVAVIGEGIAEAFTGEISGIEPRVDPATRLVSVRADVANADQRLTPGQFVRIEVALPAEDGVVSLPQTAVVTSLYGDYVYIVRPADAPPPAPQEGEAGAAAAAEAGEIADQPAGEAEAERLQVRQVFVTVGRRSARDVEIIDGVEVGDQVVTAGQNRLSNGAPVFVDNSVTPTGAAGDPEQAAAQ
jgi:membrane fusion protein (multidrug efflux system)